MKASSEIPIKFSLYWGDESDDEESYRLPAVWLNGVAVNEGNYVDPEEWLQKFICETFHDELKTLTGKSSGSDKGHGYYGLSFITDIADYKKRKNHPNYVDGCTITLHGGFSAYEKVLEAIGFMLVHVDDKNDRDNYLIFPGVKITSDDLLARKKVALNNVLKGLRKKLMKELNDYPIEFDSYRLRNVAEEHFLRERFTYKGEE